MAFSINVAVRKLGVTKLLTLKDIPNNTKSVHCEDMIKETSIQYLKQAFDLLIQNFYNI